MSLVLRAMCATPTIAGRLSLAACEFATKIIDNKAHIPDVRAVMVYLAPSMLTFEVPASVKRPRSDPSRWAPGDNGNTASRLSEYRTALGGPMVSKSFILRPNVRAPG